jgi:hypothetical protein
MKDDKLTDNGIDKLVGGIFGVTLQVLNVIKKKKGNKDFYRYLCVDAAVISAMDIAN